VSQSPIAFTAGETIEPYAFFVTTALGAPYNLTNCFAHLTVRTGTGGTGGAVVADWRSSTGGLVIDALAGKITLPLSAAASAALPAGSYVYELVVTFADGKRRVLFSGPFTVNAAIALYPDT
jgi:hypothetical protein